MVQNFQKMPLNIWTKQASSAGRAAVSKAPLMNKHRTAQTCSLSVAAARCWWCPDIWMPAVTSSLQHSHHMPPSGLHHHHLFPSSSILLAASPLGQILLISTREHLLISSAANDMLGILIRLSLAESMEGKQSLVTGDQMFYTGVSSQRRHKLLCCQVIDYFSMCLEATDALWI